MEGFSIVNTHCDLNRKITYHLCSAQKCSSMGTEWPCVLDSGICLLTRKRKDLYVLTGELGT